MSAEGVDYFFGVQEAATRLGLNIAQVRRYCAQGRLRAQLVGKTWVIRADDVEVFKDARRGPGRPRKA